MRKQTLVFVCLVAVVAVIIAWNALSVEALPIFDEKAGTPSFEERIPPASDRWVAPLVRLWPHPQASGSSTRGLLQHFEGSEQGLPSLSLLPEVTNTPAAPLPAPTNTPAAPLGDAAANVNRLPSAWTPTGIDNLPPSRAPAKELPPEIDVSKTQTLQRADALRETGLRFDVPDRVTWTDASLSPQSTSEETCVNVLLNPQLNVTEFGDGTGSIDYWSILYQKVYYDTEVYNSASYSLVLVDENNGSDTVLDPFWGTGKDYDMVGQGFQAPPSLTRIKIMFSSVFQDANADDEAWSNLFMLTPEGYLDELMAWVDVPEDSTGFTNWHWELTAADHSALLAELSGQPLAVLYDMLSDGEAPGEVVWLDDLQVMVCYQRGPYSVYLPLVRKERPPAPQPTCSPREPDSVSQPGSTTVNVTCGGSFSSLDEKDYYTLDLKGASKIRLRLFNLPSGTNWDAMIYENKAGYPLDCHIGTLGHADKFADCTLVPSKNYFVLVSRGPSATGGSYNMRVQRR